jgi:hypothetical protein
MARLGNGIRGRLMYWRDLRQYRRSAEAARDPITGYYPFYRDRFRGAGELHEYFHQDLWAARKIFQARPARHVDVGSRVDGFIGHCLVFMDLDVVDIRLLVRSPVGLCFIQADATTMADFADASIPSLSSLHAAEHFGLGRFGDTIDPAGHVTFMRSLARVLAPQGRLYFSVPVGRMQKIEFNAHRVLRTVAVLEIFASLSLLTFSLVAGGGMRENVPPAAADEIDYGVGLFEFTKA